MQKRKLEIHDTRLSKIKLNLPPGLILQAELVARMQGWGSRGAYLRDAISRMVPMDLERLPRTHLRLRPGSNIYGMKNDRFLPLAQSAGGERVWIISVGPKAPKSLGGSYTYLCDVTSADGTDGAEARGAIVLMEDCC